MPRRHMKTRNGDRFKASIEVAIVSVVSLFLLSVFLMLQAVTQDLVNVTTVLSCAIFSSEWFKLQNTHVCSGGVS